MIEVRELCREFRVLNRRRGLWGGIADLWSGDYRVVRAVSGVNMTIQPGEIVGFLGPNGAGKSTTMKMLTGILRPTSGQVLVDGQSPFTNHRNFVRDIGVVFGQRTQLWWELPVIESIQIARVMYNLGRDEFQERLAVLESLVPIAGLYKMPVRTLSLGQRMLCDLAITFLHRPKVLFLDEPTIGLDLGVKYQIRSLIQRFNREFGTTVLLTTHDVGDVEALCHRIVLIDRGSVLFDGPMGQFSKILGEKRLVKVLLKESVRPDDVVAAAGALGGVEFAPGGPESGGAGEGWLELAVDESQTSVATVLAWFFAHAPVADVRIEDVGVERVIARVYQGGLG